MDFEAILLITLIVHVVAWCGIWLYWFFFDRPAKEALKELRRRREEARVGGPSRSSRRTRPSASAGSASGSSRPPSTTLVLSS